MSHTWISWGWIQAVSFCLLSLTPSPLSPFFFILFQFTMPVYITQLNTHQKPACFTSFYKCGFTGQDVLNGNACSNSLKLSLIPVLGFCAEFSVTGTDLQSQNDVYQSWILLIAFSHVNRKCPYFPHWLNLVVKWCTSQVIVVLIRVFMRDLYQSCGYAGDILFPLMSLKSMGNLKEKFCGKLLAVFSFSHSKISIFICHLSANYNVLTTKEHEIII